jgi:nucleoside-diphosphate-sugar epimerase
MKVFVAGGSGAIGRHLVPMLVARGHSVVATTHTPQNTGTIASMGAQPVVVDGLDEAATVRAVVAASPDAIIHEMTSLAGFNDFRKFAKAFETTNRLRTEGLDYLIEGAKQAGARRIIAQSYSGLTNPRSGSWIKTEADGLDPDPLPAAAGMLSSVRYLERRLGEVPGIEGFALRYGGLYGPHTSLSADGEIVELLKKRRFPIIGGGSAVWSFVHVADAASATVAALTRGEPGVYNVVDDEPARVSEWLPYLAEVVGAPKPWRLPAWVGRLAGGKLAVTMMTELRGSSNAKAKRELGWLPEHRSWHEGFREVAVEPNIEQISEMAPRQRAS